MPLTLKWSTDWTLQQLRAISIERHSKLQESVNPEKSVVLLFDQSMEV